MEFTNGEYSVSPVQSVALFIPFRELETTKNFISAGLGGIKCKCWNKKHLKYSYNKKTKKLTVKTICENENK